MESLSRFLVQAKTASYASGQEGTILENGLRQFIFEEGNLLYKDRYLGENPFIGQEIVFRNDRPCWGMNYYGAVSHDKSPLGEVYVFLREALRNVDEARPFRGPNRFSMGPFNYANHAEGTIAGFSGSEEVTYQGQKVFRLLYHGGLIEAGSETVGEAQNLKGGHIQLTPSQGRFVGSSDTCRLATISPKGWPHCVPVGYLFKAGKFYIPSDKQSKKTRNLRKNGRACIVIDDDEGRGLMVQGMVEIVEGGRFAKLRDWMRAETGWTVGDVSDGSMLVLTPTKTAEWR